MTKSKFILSGILFALSAFAVIAFQNCGQGFSAANLSGFSNTALTSQSPHSTTNCQADAICINSKSTTGQTIDVKMINFTNDNGAATAATLLSSTDTSFTASFMTPAGRTMTATFTLQGNTIVPTAAKGSRLQFCANANLDPCAIVTVNNLQQYNCGSPLHWTGAFAGDTRSQSVTCTAAAQASSPAAPVTVDPAAAAYITFLQQTASDVSQRLSNSNTNDAERSVIQGLMGAPTGAPPSSYGAPLTYDPSTLPQISGGCANRVETAQPNENVVPYGPAVDLLTIPMKPLGSLKVDQSLSCVPYGQWCIVTFRGKSDGTCTASAGIGPAYNCTSSWALSCKQFCESTMSYLHLPSGKGWTCNYGNYYSQTPNHDPNTYKETDRQGVAWDL